MRRKVEITVGRPEELGGAEPVEGIASSDESFCINFIEDGESEFTAEACCLCTLSNGVSAWLMGLSPEEVQVSMASDHH